MLQGQRMASSIICWLTGPQYANLICYAFVWIAMLYHLLVCSFIPISGWPCYIIFWFANLYLCLVCKFIPISVIKYYTYFCYGYFCFFQIWFQTCYIYFWFAILYLRLLYPILVYSILLVMASSVISSSAPPLTKVRAVYKKKSVRDHIMWVTHPVQG